MSRACAGPSLSVTLCRDPRQFAALEGPWNRLVRACPTATPFQSHAWLHSWWLSYGKEGRLRLVLVRRGEELVGAAALMLVHRPMPLLVPLGGAITDWLGRGGGGRAAPPRALGGGPRGGGGGPRGGGGRR
ncbi:hypothetical protein ACFXD5_36680, partial [Streptomyces sp. NPDC059385]